jgi:hypothetical protein
LVSGAQNTDKGLWTSIELRKKLGQNVSLSLEEEYRQIGRIGKTDRFMTTADLSFKPTGFLKCGASYTLINKYRDVDMRLWETRHRYGAYVSGSIDWNRWEFSLREKFQSTNRVGISSDEHVSNPTNLIRSKLSVNYNVKKFPLDPYFSFELFHALNEPDGDMTGGSVFKFTGRRTELGLDYKVSKSCSVSLGYLYDVSEDWDDFRINGYRLGKYEIAYEHIVVLGIKYSL